MQLRKARLCLDCEEVHDERRCPVCASEAFTYLTRWVPAPERRARPREPAPADLEIYRRLLAHGSARSPGRGLVKHALLGLTAAGVLGLFWGSHSARRTADPQDDEPDDG
jgi:hypothetical protein